METERNWISAQSNGPADGGLLLMHVVSQTTVFETVWPADITRKSFVERRTFKKVWEASAKRCLFEHIQEKQPHLIV